MATGIPIYRQQKQPTDDKSNVNITTTSEVSMLFDENEKDTSRNEREQHQRNASPKRAITLKINQIKNKRQDPNMNIQQISPIKSTFTE